MKLPGFIKTTGLSNPRFGESFVEDIWCFLVNYKFQRTKNMSSSAADFRLGLTLGLGNRSVEDIWCFLVNYKFQRSENSSSSAVDFMLGLTWCFHVQ